LTTGVTDAAPAPQGWYRVLNGQQFAAQGAVFAMVGSQSRQGNLIGCSLPARAASAPPVLVLSSDGGHTWQSRRIPGAAPLSLCSVVADSEQPDTYVVGPGAFGSNLPPTIYETIDGGAAWHALAPPSGYEISVIAASTTFVNGYFFTYLNPTAGGSPRFAELPPEGAWRMLDEHLPYALTQGAPENFYNTPEAFSVDPADPTHIYAAMDTGPEGVSLFSTQDSGITWKQVYRLPTSTRVAVWTASDSRVYIQDQIDYGVANQFFASADGGATWAGAGLHNRGADQIFVGPDGRVITLYGGSVFNLDPMSGVFTKLGAAPTFRSYSLCAMSSGTSATLVCGDGYDTYARSLPAAG
jgi:hypothetical protein